MRRKFRLRATYNRLNPLGRYETLAKCGLCNHLLIKWTYGFRRRKTKKRKKWAKRRKERGFFTNIVQELHFKRNEIKEFSVVSISKHLIVKNKHSKFVKNIWSAPSWLFPLHKQREFRKCWTKTSQIDPTCKSVIATPLILRKCWMKCLMAIKLHPTSSNMIFVLTKRSSKTLENFDVSTSNLKILCTISFCRYFTQNLFLGPFCETIYFFNHSGSQQEMWNAYNSW